MSYYADPDRYYYGTTAREAFDSLERAESRIRRDRLALTAASPAADPTPTSRLTTGATAAVVDSPGPALPDVSGRQIDLFGRLNGGR